MADASEIVLLQGNPMFFRRGMNCSFSYYMIGRNNYMQQLKAHKYRIYPTTDQANQLAQFFGAKRWLFEQRKISDAIADMGAIPKGLTEND